MSMNSFYIKIFFCNCPHKNLPSLNINKYKQHVSNIINIRIIIEIIISIIVGNIINNDINNN